ncbi:hypothetical protein AVEN_25681-1 [Araneus ventricosus]|uniref:Uncharacterized protein n=1 Tax=Araneus ventricosus TaxID=182803 RepID=A0A4Y2TXH2_ARAVE|nr:hypothetical protein AVEN_25681-1 [Araneus ventricosus]
MNQKDFILVRADSSLHLSGHLHQWVLSRLRGPVLCARFPYDWRGKLIESSPPLFAPDEPQYRTVSSVTRLSAEKDELGDRADSQFAHLRLHGLICMVSPALYLSEVICLETRQ